ncbi:hypothetical protein JOB18_032334 [Solea senegalensis]|uniref:Uncharacterized protein n=1 Tax=Solea senegalensis TaxID=28829 RepID=A0AAV6QY61_SOLSE|nr:hypothetical protein JOB18_032334 [Solea senegalensis]
MFLEKDEVLGPCRVVELPRDSSEAAKPSTDSVCPAGEEGVYLVNAEELQDHTPETRLSCSDVDGAKTAKPLDSQNGGKSPPFSMSAVKWKAVVLCSRTNTTYSII